MAFRFFGAAYKKPENRSGLRLINTKEILIKLVGQRMVKTGEYLHESRTMKLNN